MRRCLLLATIGVAAVAMGAQAEAQTADSDLPRTPQGTFVSTPPSVDAGIGNGVVKPSNSPSVNNGVSNGVVKKPGSPSVDDGIANGVVKSSTVNQ